MNNSYNDSYQRLVEHGALLYLAHEKLRELGWPRPWITLNFPDLKFEFSDTSGRFTADTAAISHIRPFTIGTDKDGQSGFMGSDIEIALTLYENGDCYVHEDERTKYKHEYDDNCHVVRTSAEFPATMYHILRMNPVTGLPHPEDMHETEMLSAVRLAKLASAITRIGRQHVLPL